MSFEPRGDAIQQKPSSNEGDLSYGTPAKANEAMYTKCLSFSTSDHATKRVIAPYVRIMRKGQKEPKATEQPEEPEFTFFLQRKPSVLQRNLSAFLSDTVDLPELMHESADVLKRTTKANGMCIFISNSTITILTCSAI